MQSKKRWTCKLKIRKFLCSILQFLQIHKILDVPVHKLKMSKKVLIIPQTIFSDMLKGVWHEVFAFRFFS